MENMQIFSLTPKRIENSDASYEAVKELKDVLKEAITKKKIKNIALTGPYGSGKSSILQTLQEDVTDYKYLPISLATLQSEDENNNSNNEETESERCTRIENLNRKIEYSIVQQLIYREKQKDVPNSRLRRIYQLTEAELIMGSASIVLFILALLVLFEPNSIKVDSIYNALNLGKYNVYFDYIAAMYIIFYLFSCIKYFINAFSNSKLNKLNLKDGVIEVVDNNSIFNKHLDEILYFFQMTKYNVVFIEDLDRFGTSNIFLKLRELNFLINESQIIKRHIVFIYAVKDDIFINEERTKFFDYIVTVIPIINPSNSKDKLKEALEERHCEENEIKDEDLSEMGFFIQDMRILTNIANEYSQYKKKLISKDYNNKLDLTSLLAMIVYKNYYPKDFSQLHRREGKVYKCINSKKEFINLALKEINEKEKAADSNSKCEIKVKN